MDDSLTPGPQWRSYIGEWEAGGEREGFLLASTGEAAPDGNPDIIPLQGAGELTEEDRRTLESQGVPTDPEFCDDVSVVRDRISLDPRNQLSREEISRTGRELSRGYVLRQLEIFLNSVKKPGGIIRQLSTVFAPKQNCIHVVSSRLKYQYGVCRMITVQYIQTGNLGGRAQIETSFGL